MAYVRSELQIPRAVFDANIGVGHRKDRAYPYEGPEQLLAEMNRHGVDRAVVYACEGELVSAIRGNESLARWTEGNNGLVPQQVIGPDADSLSHIAGLHADGLVSSVRFHSTEVSRLSFVQWVYGDALSWLVDERIPLWMSLADTPSTEIVETLRHYPNLRLVLVGAHYTHSLVLRPMLRAPPHAVLELSRYENLRGMDGSSKRSEPNV